MLKEYSSSRQKSLKRYFRCLSSCCFDGIMGEYFTVFEFNPINRVFRKGQAKMALKKWNIKNADEMKSIINGLLDTTSGLSSEYRKLHETLFALPESSREKYLESRKDHDEYGKLTIVNVSLHQMPSGDIFGYEAAWAVALSRIGEFKGWMTAEEAWQLKLHAARMLQSRYDSWSDYFVAYCIGTHFDEEKPEIKHYMRSSAMFTLLEMSSLPYKKAAWNTNLEPDRAV